MPKRESSISRRRFLEAALLAGINLSPLKAAFAENVCDLEGYGQSCDAKIPTAQFGRVVALQEKLFWCWAASLEMVFRWYGKDIQQQDIVRQTFGSELNAPANPFVLMSVLNRNFIDRSGSTFAVSSQLWSWDFGISQINNGRIIERLSQRSPLIVCNLSHMMVLVGLNYFRPSNGAVTVREAWVADPMLRGSVTGHMGIRALPPGFRYLFPAEMTAVHYGGQLRFMADVQLN